MIHKVKLKLSNGFYEIIYGKGFSAKSDGIKHLIYEENETWYVCSDPNNRSGGNAVIEIPFDAQLKSFILEGTDIALKCDTVKADTIYFDLKNSAGEVSSIHGKKIGISMGKGDVRAVIGSFNTLKIDCGYGRVNVELPFERCGYNITSDCGMGEVILNSIKLPRQYTKNGSEKNIDVVCGMGCVNINTSLR